MSGQHSNKERCSNFSNDETSKLMLLLQDFPVITCKKTDHASNQQKEAAWKLLVDKFNADATKYRSIKQLQQKYNNMKKTARKEMAAEKYGRRQTGGGPCPPKPSETTEWLNTIMGESISGLPAIYDSDALDATLVTLETPVEADDITAKIDLSEHFDKEDAPTSIIVLEDTLKENTNTDLPFDSSTPKAMLRKPVSKELSFNNKRKTAFTPLETRKRIIQHADKKVNYINQKQIQEKEIAQYAKEEHEQNMRHKEELHKIEVEFKKKLCDLVLEKSKYEAEKAKLEYNKVLNM